MNERRAKFTPSTRRSFDEERKEKKTYQARNLKSQAKAKGRAIEMESISAQMALPVSRKSLSDLPRSVLGMLNSA